MILTRPVSSCLLTIVIVSLCIGQTLGEKANRIFDYEPTELRTFEYLLEALGSDYKSLDYRDEQATIFHTYKLLAGTEPGYGLICGASVEELLELNTWDIGTDCTKASLMKRWHYCVTLAAKPTNWLIGSHLRSYCMHMKDRVEEECRLELYRAAERDLANYEGIVREFYQDVRRGNPENRLEEQMVIKRVVNQDDKYDLRKLKELCLMFETKYELAFEFALRTIPTGSNSIWSDYQLICRDIYDCVKTTTIGDTTTNEIFHYEPTTTDSVYTLDEMVEKLEFDRIPSDRHYQLYKLLASTTDKDNEKYGFSVRQLLELSTWKDTECTTAEYLRRFELYGQVDSSHLKSSAKLASYCSGMIHIFGKECSSRLFELAQVELAEHMNFVGKFYEDVKSYLDKRPYFDKRIFLDKRTFLDDRTYLDKGTFLGKRRPLSAGEVVEKVLAKKKYPLKELKMICSILEQKYSLLVYRPNFWSRYYNLCEYITSY